MLVSIHQPMYFPYLGFFNKIQRSDVFVFLDDAKYSDGYYYNRNKIKTSCGTQLLTVPLNKSSSEKLNEILISNNTQWQKKHLKAIVANYGKSKYFKDYIDFFEEVFDKNWTKLHNLNMETINFLLQELEIECEFYFSSDFTQVKSNGTQRLVDICELLGGDEYLSGISGKEYLNEALFHECEIKVEYQEYTPIEYTQLWGEFIPNLSIIDVLLNMGTNLKRII